MKSVDLLGSLFIDITGIPSDEMITFEYTPRQYGFDSSNLLQQYISTAMTNITNFDIISESTGSNNDYNM